MRAGGSTAICWCDEYVRSKLKWRSAGYSNMLILIAVPCKHLRADALICQVSLKWFHHSRWPFLNSRFLSIISPIGTGPACNVSRRDEDEPEDRCLVVRASIWSATPCYSYKPTSAHRCYTSTPTLSAPSIHLHPDSAISLLRCLILWMTTSPGIKII